jgi:hypothetical protein
MDYFHTVSFRDADPEKFNLTDLAESIYMLCRFVKWAHGGQPVILLIDEVDAPVNAIVSADCVSKDRESALQLLSDLLTNALKLGTQPTTDDLGPPEVVERALLTGVLPIALHGISSADPGRYHINQIGNLQASADPVI